VRYVRIVRLLGKVFQVYSVFLLLPLVGSLYWDAEAPLTVLSDHLPFDLKLTTASYLITFLFTFLLGVLLTTLSPPFHEDLREREAFIIVGTGWLFCALLGTLPFLLTGATTQVTVALFESMSGITTTGYSALAAPMEQYPESVHLWRASLHFFGGLGIVLVAVAVISRLTEGAVKLLSLEAGGGDVQRLRPTLSQTAKSLFGVYVTFNFLAFVSLLLAIRYTSDVTTWKDAVFHALVHSIGAIATGGMSSRTNSVASFDSPLVGVIMFILIVGSGVSFVLYYRAVHGTPTVLVRSPEFRFYLGVIAAASLAVAGFLWYDGRDPWAAVLLGPYTVATTITTAGYTMTDANQFPDGAKLVLLLLMFTGGMVGSTAGGLKTARIYLLLRLALQELQKLLHPHAVSVVKLGGRIFPEETMRRIVVFFFTFITIFIAGAFGFALLGFDFQTSLVASIRRLGRLRPHGSRSPAAGLRPHVDGTPGNFHGPPAFPAIHVPRLGRQD
jgi:trk system potassium uptake protein